MDVAAGSWANQKVMVQLTAPIYAVGGPENGARGLPGAGGKLTSRLHQGYAVATVLQGLALGRFASFFSSDVATLHSKWYRVYLIGVGCLLVVYSAFTFEEVCFYGSKC